MDKYGPTVDGLMQFMDASVCNFFAVRTLREMLDASGFVCLDSHDKWELRRGGKYYIVKNDSALFAFVVGEGDPADGFKIISAHSDSPGFRIKPNPEMMSDGGVVKLNTEVYGGPILYTWFDRPLSIAGRVILKSDDPLNPTVKLVRFDRPLLTIPHLAIHFNRGVNEGNPLSKQKDMLPVLGIIKEKAEKNGLVLRMVASELGVDSSDILDFDLSLYDTAKAAIVGLEGEFVISGRLDDLSMVHAAVSALLTAEGVDKRTRVMAIFDNEETGSGTKQGAASPVLMNALRRIVGALGGSEEDYLRGVANSFMVSADNAHALHPNYPEKQDPTNHPVVGGGPVIKINANCKYMSDSRGAAVFNELCREAGVKAQYFVTPRASAGGSTLGNIATSQFDIEGVDVGNAIWAMHSAAETASVDDQLAMVKAMRLFFR